jgi:DNA polymerase III subunit epsilon
MLREIVLDTETTGLSPQSGDRVVEIGCVELINHIPSGKNYHAYINPERDMPEGAYRVHGLSEEFLSQKPLFSEVVADFSAFVADSTLIIHNAPFDMGFLKAEFDKVGHKLLQNDVIDTVQLARKRHPGARVSLDALCKHYGIDNSRRELHGALLDSEILAEVYLELIGGRQVGFLLSSGILDTSDNPSVMPGAPPDYGQRPAKLASKLTPEQIRAQQEAHRELIRSLGEDAIWNRYQ